MLRKHLKLLLSVTQLLILMVWVSHALAGQAQLAWDAPTTNTDGTPLTDLAGYLLYWKDSSGVPESVDVGNHTTYTLTDLVEDQSYSFAVVAYNTSRIESDDSNTVTTTIIPSNHAPVALADTASTPARTPVAIAVLANDSDSDGNPLAITAMTQAAYGTVTSSGTTVTYTPAANFAGLDSFTYTITDGQGASATAPVTVTVTLVNYAPVALSDAVATPVGAPIAIAVLANDSDPDGNPLTIKAVTQGAHGAVTIKGGTVTYTPAANFVGTDSFTYTITDGYGGSTTATVNVTVFVMVQLEAEAGTFYAPMAVGTATTDPALQYVWVPDNSADTLDPLQDGGYVQYSFTVPKADAYVVWGRVSPSATGIGSFFFGLDVPAGNGLITQISPTTYKAATIHVGDQYYIDSSSTITALPTGFDALSAIKTANADKGNKKAKFLTLTLLQDATLYVAYDAEVSSFPSWLTSSFPSWLTSSFTNTGQSIGTTNGPMAVWKKDVPAGPITLPGNRYQVPRPEKSQSQYFVLLDFHGEEPYLLWDVTPKPWIWDQAASDTSPIFFLEAGSHTLTIRQRESGTRLDKLIITNHLTLIPHD